MTGSRRALTAVALLVVALGAYGFGALTAARSDTGRPYWVKADGTVDEARRPACVNVSKEDGSLVIGKDGKPVCLAYDSWVHKLPAGVVKRTIRHLPDGGIREEVETESYGWRDIVPKELLPAEQP